MNAADTPTIEFDGLLKHPTEDFTVPVAPQTKDLYSYQLASIQQILIHRRVILGLQPGLGKTAILQAVAAAVAQRGGKTLVVVPPSLRLMWQEEFAKDYPQLTVKPSLGGKDQPLPDADVVIMNDSTLQNRTENIVEWAPDALLIDEAHRMKNADAKRTKATIELSDALDDDAIVVMATGTLSTNNAGDVYCPIRVTGKDNATKVSGASTWPIFLDRWCETVMAWKKRVVVGCQDVEGLRKRLVTTCMINIPRDEVLDLPDRTFQNVNLVLDADSQSKYNIVQKHFLTWVQANYGDEAMIRASKAEAMVKLMRLWEVDGVVKAKATVDYVKDLVDQDEQVVVMAHHSAVIEAIVVKLAAAGVNVATIKGGMTAEDKNEVVMLFQAGLIDVIVGQITAAGVGLTLTAARHIVFAQLPWSPASFGQATDRIYRIGQTRSCSVHVLNMEGGVSQKLWNVLQTKAQVVDGINNGKATIIDQGSVINAILDEYGWQQVS